jgi:hypothetical protein
VSAERPELPFGQKTPSFGFEFFPREIALDA